MERNPGPGEKAGSKSRKDYHKLRYQQLVQPFRTPKPKPLRMIVNTLPRELKLLKAVSLIGIRIGIINVNDFQEEKNSTDSIRRMLGDENHQEEEKENQQIIVDRVYTLWSEERQAIKNGNKVDVFDKKKLKDKSALEIQVRIDAQVTNLRAELGLEQVQNEQEESIQEDEIQEAIDLDQRLQPRQQLKEDAMRASSQSALEEEKVNPHEMLQQDSMEQVPLREDVDPMNDQDHEEVAMIGESHDENFQEGHSKSPLVELPMEDVSMLNVLAFENKEISISMSSMAQNPTTDRDMGKGDETLTEIFSSASKAIPTSPSRFSITPQQNFSFSIKERFKEYENNWRIGKSRLMSLKTFTEVFNNKSKRLQKLYKLIDKSGQLLIAQDEQYKPADPTYTGALTRQRAVVDKGIGQKGRSTAVPVPSGSSTAATKSKSSKASQSEMDFKSSSGYGEHTIGQFDTLIETLCKIDQLPEMQELQIENAKEYRLDENSVFFDLGSGLGKPCMHMSFMVGCRSYGLEMEKMRFHGSKESLFIASGDPLLRGEWTSKVVFEFGNASYLKSFVHPDDGSNFSHIYSYNKLMNEEELEVVSGILNNSEFKVLAWSKNKFQTENSGLKDCKLIYKQSTTNTGGNTFMMYFYAKLPPHMRGLKVKSKEEVKVPASQDENQIMDSKSNKGRNSKGTISRELKNLVSSLKGDDNLKEDEVEHEWVGSKRQMSTCVEELYKSMCQHSQSNSFDKLRKKFYHMTTLTKRGPIYDFQIAFNGKITHLIQQGGFGRVFTFQGNNSKKLYAIKISKATDNHLNELKFIKTLARSKTSTYGNFITRAVKSRIEDDQVAIVQEIYPIRFNELVDHDIISGQLIKSIIFCLATAVQHCHQNNIAHCDIKPDNVMLSKDLVPHLIDFGLAFHPQVSKDGRMRGTSSYQPPEADKIEDGDLEHFKRQDVWGLGLLFYSLVYNRIPRDISNIEYRTPFARGELSFEFIRGAKNLLPRILAYRRRDRLTIEEIIEDPFFEDVRQSLKDKNNKLDFLGMVAPDKAKIVKGLVKKYYKKFAKLPFLV